MNSKKVLIGGIVGGVAFFLVGFLIFGMLLSGFMASHAGSAGNLMRPSNQMDFLPLVIGNFAWGFLLSLILNMGPVNLNKGIMIGGTVGFLMDAGYQGITLGTTGIMSHTGALVDVIAFTVMSAIAGAIIALVIGMGKKSAMA